MNGRTIENPRCARFPPQGCAFVGPFGPRTAPPKTAPDEAQWPRDGCRRGVRCLCLGTELTRATSGVPFTRGLPPPRQQVSFGPETASHGAQTAPNGPKRPQTVPKWPQTAPNGPKRPQTAPNGPKTAPNGPKRPQNGPKAAPNGPKTAPNGPKRPQTAPNGPWRARDSCPTVGALTLMHDIGLARS